MRQQTRLVRVVIGGVEDARVRELAARFSAYDFTPDILRPGVPREPPSPSAPAPLALIVSVAGADLVDIAPVIRHAVRTLPDTPLILHTNVNGLVTAQAALQFAGARATDALIVPRIDDPLLLRSTVLKARAKFVAQQVLGANTGEDSPERIVPWLIISTGIRSLTAEGLAMLAGLPYRSFLRALEKLAWPEPKRCIQWGQLVVCADLMEHCKVSPATVAQWTGLHDTRPLTAATALLLGTRLTRLGDAGTLALVGQRFRDALPASK